MENQVCGIYCLHSKSNGKRYIGSSKDIVFRFRAHISKLKNGKHVNQHLQNAFNKYGLEDFNFCILEECLPSELLHKEQQQINSFSWDLLYNKSKIAAGGGSDTIQIPLYLLNLKGGIVRMFRSGAELARYLNRPIIDYTTVNTKTISQKQYRIVTTEYYENNLQEVLSWKSYSNEAKNKIHLKSLEQYKIIKDDQEYVVSSKKSIANITKLSTQRISQIFQLIDSKGLEKYFSKKHGFSIQYLK